MSSWLGSRWQAKEARAARQEQSQREDRLRYEAERRNLYARFALMADTAAGGKYAALEGDLYRLRWEIGLLASPDVVQAAHRLTQALGGVGPHAEDPYVEIANFVHAVRAELGFPNDGLLPEHF
ncbi:hypothetical protein ACQPZZ_01890 [Microbispora sp. CA-135349]|uniref:hypothetical protein n=1 Tax=Microbispora sp. CA-135349 TaxID=3239953 RepID=UPI003D911794